MKEEHESCLAKTLEDIERLPEVVTGAHCVVEDETVLIRFRILRKTRQDGSLADLPEITASKGNNQRIHLKLAASKVWYLRSHRGDFEFNKQVLQYLNGEFQAIGGQVEQVLGESV